MTTHQPPSEPTPVPPPPPAKRTNVFAVIAAAFAALAIGLAAGIAIGTNLDDDEPLAASSNADDDQPAAQNTQTPRSTLTATPKPSPTPTGPKVFELGDGGTYSENGESVGAITVESAVTATEAPDEYSDPPANGIFLTVTVVATALDGQLYDINPWDFYVRDGDGNRWDLSAGNPFYPDDMLNATTLNGGETIRGTVTFDVPPEATELVYAPMNRAIAVWHVTT